MQTLSELPSHALSKSPRSHLQRCEPRAHKSPHSEGNAQVATATSASGLTDVDGQRIQCMIELQTVMICQDFLPCPAEKIRKALAPIPGPPPPGKDVMRRREKMKEISRERNVKRKTCQEKPNKTGVTTKEVKRK